MTTSPTAVRPAVPLAPPLYAVTAEGAQTSGSRALAARVGTWAGDVLLVAAALVLLPVVILLVGAPIALVVRLIMAVTQGG